MTIAAALGISLHSTMADLRAKIVTLQDGLRDIGATEPADI